MTIRKSHLQIALAVLVLSVVYNLWVFLRPSRSVQPVVPEPGTLESQMARATMTADGGALAAALSPAVGSSDPANIPAPPPIDLASPPSWARDPFLFGDETRTPPDQAEAPAPDPVVRSILYSSSRRLAVVDGRIVGVGEQIGTGRIVEIARDGVVIRSADGVQRRVPLGGRQVTPAGSRK
jgi:hypothetical protein